ncbi:hypothetical protein RUND412_000732 [Rhizina undulata]
MVRTKRKDETEKRPGKSAEKTQKRKRRKKARTDVSSSESSSDSSDGEVEVTRPSVGASVRDDDVEVEDAPDVPMRIVEDDEHEAHEEQDEEGLKRGRIPEQLRNLHDPEAAQKFEEYYLRLITQEFGDDLNNVRQAKDFGDRSLPMLVRALKQGVNIFDVGEKRLVIGDRA